MVGLWDSARFGEGSGEREGKFRNVSAPPQPTPKDKFASKPNHLLKPREKVSEKPSEKPCGKPSEKPCEEPHPKPKPRPIRFHCEYCGKDGHKREFCYKGRREVRMAKEWANKDGYHPSHGVPKPRMPLPKGKGFVHTVPAWRDRRVPGERKFAGRGPLARPVRVTGQTGARQSAGEFGFHGRDARGFSPFSRGTDGKHL
jgi:outer membrane biosynthesis protein TonB